MIQNLDNHQTYLAFKCCYTCMSTERVQQVKKNFLQESGIQFSELEEKVLQFHLSNLEYACGSTLDQVCQPQTPKD